jgi:hypothetical protein
MLNMLHNPSLLSVVMLDVIMLSVVILNVIMLSVVMLCVIMLNVVAPFGPQGGLGGEKDAS